MSVYHFILFPLIFLLGGCSQPDTTTGTEVLQQNNAQAVPDTAGLAKATFAGGCFWCTEAYFERLVGVEAVISGYVGGKEEHPTYEQVSNGRTGHAEGVQVYYHPDQISYAELVEIFFATHDPTTLNRQGPDVGKQYRSAIFYRTPAEKKMIDEQIKKLNASGKYKNKIVTQVEPFRKFWPAEAYHQDYYALNPGDIYVLRVAKPKVQKFEKAYAGKLKPAYRK
ncbi:peptide-methionine (S)-S-oxide reductase MsrA [Pontibacter burrus]|uniref:Peptide methionine sulfoxide reductase MsrA n=1 Tax=Pontibacter burrus TaxID=2704466 RepID=A0A6B3LSJ1_9BACT|nr:peptide-methionine (S)-S-oxide reductase MsrA [Pontibacter burrus]NEM98773.1 peptide-methionine (S)-S-oxide reductase MsrA [Pontibacter burrus]